MVLHQACTRLQNLVFLPLKTKGTLRRSITLPNIQQSYGRAIALPSPRRATSKKIPSAAGFIQTLDEQLGISHKAQSYAPNFFLMPEVASRRLGSQTRARPRHQQHRPLEVAISMSREDESQKVGIHVHYSAMHQLVLGILYQYYSATVSRTHCYFAVRLTFCSSDSLVFHVRRQVQPWALAQ